MAGDRAAFSQLVEHYQRRIFSLAFRYVRNEADAADLTQQTFLNAFERLGKLKRPSAFCGWLFRITVNLAKNQLRFHASKTFQDVDDLTLSRPAEGEARLQRKAERDAMRCAIAELPDKQRRCLLLRIDGDLSFREIGEAVGCSEGSARVNYHHGLRALRESLNAESK
jgi:RNA polymerase sigma-70 factor (ECF subfamily)